MFYPFLNKQEGNVAFDSYTFCEVMNKRGKDMGDEAYANRWMRAHYNSWYTDDDIKALADRQIKRVRLPIGDWTMNKYGPYVGCMDGDVERIQWLLDTCFKYQIEVLLDVHTARGS